MAEIARINIQNLQNPVVETDPTEVPA